MGLLAGVQDLGAPAPMPLAVGRSAVGGFAHDAAISVANHFTITCWKTSIVMPFARAEVSTPKRESDMLETGSLRPGVWAGMI